MGMSIVFVLKYVVKYEKRTQFQALVKRFIGFKKKNPKAFEGLISFRLFEEEFGGVAGSFVEMWECKSLEEFDKVSARIMKHREMKGIHAEFHKMIDHSAYTQLVWNAVT